MGACQSRSPQATPQGANLPEYTSEQRNWAKAEREDEELNEQCTQAWAREGRHDALQTMFQALVDERGIRGSPTHPAAIRLGTLYGVVRLALAQLGEMYAMPAQNMSFLRPVPPTLPPPLGSVFITRPHDLIDILGTWMEPPMAKDVILSQFAMAMEFVLWTASKPVFDAVVARAVGVVDEREPDPESDPIVVLAGKVDVAEPMPQALPGQQQQQALDNGEFVDLAALAGAEETKAGSTQSRESDQVDSFLRHVPGKSSRSLRSSHPSLEGLVTPTRRKIASREGDDEGGDTGSDASGVDRVDSFLRNVPGKSGRAFRSSVSSQDGVLTPTRKGFVSCDDSSP